MALIQSVEGFSLAGLCDSSLDPLLAASRGLDLPVSTDLSVLLSTVSPDIIVLATPPRSRIELVRSISRCPSVRAVVIEKPLALSVREADEILAMCQAHGIMPFVFHQLRQCPEFGLLRLSVQNGALGQVERVEAWSFGKLFDQGSHLVDVLHWLLPASAPLWIEAESCDDLKALAQWVSLPPFFTRDIRHPGAAWVSAELGLTGGTRVQLHCGPRAPLTRPELGPWLQKRLVVHGTDAIAEAHVSSHFCIRDFKSGHAREIASPEGSYHAAQVAIYGSIRSALSDPSHQMTDPAGLRRTVEILEAAEVSAALGRPLTFPLGASMTTCTSVERPPVVGVDVHRQDDRPRVSVILPMSDHRGMGVDAVHSWAAEQDCSSRDYELILILDQTVAHLEEPLRNLLRQQDQLLHGEGVELQQYHLGATRARGDLLFFSEPHCLAEPDTIAQIIRFMDSRPVDGLCARTVPICVNPMGRAESRIFDEGFSEWSRPEHWVKVIIRGFCIRKSSYESIRGFEYRYDRFAEWLMAARLRSRGYVIEYAPDVAVRHRYGDNFGLFDKDIRDFTEGECEFRLHSGEPQLAHDYFGEPPEWSAALAVRYVPPFAAMGALARRVYPWSRSAEMALTRGDCVRVLARWVFAKLLAQPSMLWSHGLPVILAKLAFRCSLTDDQRARWFKAYYEARTSFCRVQFAFAFTESTVGTGRRDYPMAALDDHDLWGFSNREWHQGAAFRWSQPFAAIRLRIPPDDYRGWLRLAAVRALDAAELALFIDDRPVHITELDQASWTIHFDVPAGTLASGEEHWLTIHVARWKDPEALKTDVRQLGLPVRCVEFQPVTGELSLEMREAAGMEHRLTGAA